MGIFLIILGILGIIWCLLPFFMYGIIGIGNITGVFCFTLLAFIGVFWKKLMARKAAVLAGKYAWTVWAVRIFLIAFACLVIFLTILMCMGCNKKAKQGATVVVLGCLVKDYGPSLMLRERLDATLDYLNENKDCACILSGGQGKDEPMTEAKAMYDYLVERGVDPSRLYLEDKSQDTEENIRFSKQIIEENGLTPEIVIISNEFHLYRAGCLADRQGVTYGTYPARTHWWMFMTYYIRELYGILAECILHIA